MGFSLARRGHGRKRFKMRCTALSLVVSALFATAAAAQEAVLHHVWPGTNGWYVALEGTSSGIPLSCQLAKSDANKPSPNTFGITYDSRGLLVWVRKDAVDPGRDPELLLSVDGHAIGSFTVSVVLVDPNIQPMIAARPPVFQQRPLLAALQQGKQVEIRTKTFLLQFDLGGIDTAIKQLFECRDQLTH